jgi:outer membrane protein assembly factor BamB
LKASGEALFSPKMNRLTGSIPPPATNPNSNFCHKMLTEGVSVTKTQPGRVTRAILAPGLAFLLLVTLVQADDWPQWRGPQRNGISAETGWRDTWPGDGPPIAWKANVGLGFSSFVVAGARAFTMGHANEQDTVWCFDANNGKVLWKHSYPADLGDKFFEGGTTGTPTIVGDRVFTLSRWGDIFCFEAATGKIVWSKNIQKDTGVTVPSWGFTGAPLAY